MQLAALLRNDRRMSLAAVLTLALGLLGFGLACGGSSRDGTIVLPPGGSPIGQLICSITGIIPGDVVVQGSVIPVSFRISDVNLPDAGRFLPVSFEVLGGYLANPPDVTDADGFARVTLVTDPRYFGNAFVRLIQPDSDLRCDITFRLAQPACRLSVAEVLDETGTPVMGAAGCGARVETTSDVERTVVFLIERPDPVSGAVLPVPGAFVLIRVSGTVPRSFQFGPANASGEVRVVVGEGGDVEGAPGQVGEITVTAEVVIPDSNDDGLPDALPCGTCAAVVNISDPPCDQDGATVAVAYPFMDVLRPGEMADLSLQLTRNGMPIGNEELFVTAENGALNGSAQPIRIMTDALGNAAVAYEPFAGFGGTLADPAVDTIRFQAAASQIECSLSGAVNVATCGIELDFVPPAMQGVLSAVTVTVTNVDTSTTDGRTVALSALGGSLSPPADVSGPLATASRTINFLAGNTSNAGGMALSFIDGYPCNTATAVFNILPSP